MPWQKEIYEVLAVLSVIALVLERVVEFIVANLFPTRPGLFGPESNSRRLATFLLATGFGTLIVAQTSLGILHRVSPTVDRWFDTVFTGLLVAAGTQPIHSVLRFMELKKETEKAKLKG